MRSIRHYDARLIIADDIEHILLKDHPVRKVLVLVVLCLFVVPASWTAGQTTELMTMAINSVRTGSFPKIVVTANVYDSLGQPVRGLMRENFAIKGDLAGLVSILDVENVTDDNLPLATVLAIDVSTSMEGTPIESARAAAQLFVDSLRPNDEVAIVTFGSVTTVVQEFTTDRDSVSRAIASLTPGGQTALYQGAFEAVRLAANSPIPRRAVILLSDGAEFGGRSQAGRDAAVQEAVPNDVPVYTIGLGFGADRTYLAELSGGTAAQFFESPNPDQLDAIYTDLSALFRSQYILTLETGIPGDGRNYVLRLQADTQLGSAAAEALFRVPIPVPIVRILAVPNRIIDTPVSYTIDVLADDELTQVTVDSGDGAIPLVDFVSPYSVNIDPQTLSPGPRIFTIRASDETGDVGEASFTAEIAALPPIATITNLQPGETLRESRVVNVAYMSQTPVIRVNFLMDGLPYGQRLSPPYEAPLDVFQLTGGGHILSVIADNAAGVTAQQDIAFNVDENIGLTLTALLPTDTPLPTRPPLGTTPGAGDAILPALTGTPATGIPGGSVQATVNAQSTAEQIAAIGTADARATSAQVITNATADAGATADFRSTFEAANAAATEQLATADAEAQATRQQQAQATAAQIAEAATQNAATATNSAATAESIQTLALEETQVANLQATQTTIAQVVALRQTVEAQATRDIDATQTVNAATATSNAATAQALQTLAAEATQVANSQATQTTIAQAITLRQTLDAQATQDIGATQTINAATATSNAATAQAMQTLAAEETQVANLQATQTTIAQVFALRQTLDAQATQDIGATQTLNAATQTAASATRAAATLEAQALLDAQASQTASAATAQALTAQAAATDQALLTQAAATQAALLTQAAATQQAAEAQTAAAATAIAQTQAALDAAAAQTALAATLNALATQQAATEQAQATENAATEAAAATLIAQLTQTAAASATRAAATDQAATQRALATENARATQTALVAITRSSATEAAQTQAAHASQTAAIVATTASAPSLTPSITPTLQQEEVVSQSPPIPTDLLPLTCVIGALAGVMAIIFVLIGGSQRRRDRGR